MPPVQLILPTGKVHPVLLAWGHIERTGRWAAGVSYLYRNWHTRALCTTWVPAGLIAPVDQYLHTGAYRTVTRVSLVGPPSAWPPLPPAYPDANQEWISAHRHHVDYRTAPA